MKGSEYNVLFVSVAAIVVVMAFVLGTAFMMGGLVETDVEQKTTFSILKASDAAYLAKGCLAKGGYIPMEYLEGLKADKKPLREVCGFPWGFGIKVHDYESPDADFEQDYYGYLGVSSRPIPVNIGVGNKIHLGEMRVSIK